MGRLGEVWRLFRTDAWWWAGLSAGWLATVLLDGVSVPAIDPHLDAVARPMESVATMLLAATTAVQAAALDVRAAWLVTVSPRTWWPIRLLWISAHYAFGVAMCVVATRFFVAGVEFPQLLGVWVACYGLAALGMVIAGVPLAAAAPVTFMAVFSLGHNVPPWWVNIVYNLDQLAGLWVVALALNALAIACYVPLGTRDSRRARHL